MFGRVYAEDKYNFDTFDFVSFCVGLMPRFCDLGDYYRLCNG